MAPKILKNKASRQWLLMPILSSVCFLGVFSIYGVISKNSLFVVARDPIRNKEMS